MEKKVSLTFFGGKDEIGGNQILFEYKSTKLLLDFGLSFERYSKYFAEFLQPRGCNPLFDYMEFGLIPKIKGIYRKDYCRYHNLPFPDEPSVDACLLTHAHLDHAGCINFLREDIPIICTQGTYLILKAMEDTSSFGFKDYVNLKLKYHYIKTKRGTLKRLQGEEAKLPRKFIILKPYKKYKINDVEIQVVPVDHSLPGACAFVIYTDEGNIVYTGDFRFHGRRKELTKKFVKIAKDANPVLMLCEGTRINENKNVSEEDVERKSDEIIKGSRDLVVVNFPLRDLDRLLTFFKVAEKNDRKLVVNFRQAYLLKLFEEMGNYPKLDEVCVFIKRRGWGLVGKEVFVCLLDEGDKWVSASELNREEIMKDYFRWEREFLEIENKVDCTDIRKEPHSYLFRCDNFELNQLVDIKPNGGVYIRSMTEPFSEDMLVAEKRVRNWLEHFNLLPIHQIHASGHANGVEIRKMLNKIAPQEVVPVHTKYPELFLLREL